MLCVAILIMVTICFTEDHSRPKFPDSERTTLLAQVDPQFFQQADKAALQSFANQVVLVLHTCNQNEYVAALERLKPPTKEDGTNVQNHLIIYPKLGSVIGWFAGYRAAVVRTAQGNKCHGDLREALTSSFTNGQVIIGAGIAYTNHKKRKFADVLISDQVENFVQYQKEGIEITNQGERREIESNVKRVFEDQARDWSDMKCFTCADDNRASVVHIGCIVSAPTLIRDETLRDQLMKHTPYAIGGEMEGWVLLELKKEIKREHNKDIEVIVIKGVADYGDLRKKDEWQWTAAKAAMDCIHYCLKKSGGIEFHGERNFH